MPVSAFAWMAGSWRRKPGELLFTEYGVSGPAVMQISRCVGGLGNAAGGKTHRASGPVAGLECGAGGTLLGKAAGAGRTDPGGLPDGISAKARGTNAAARSKAGTSRPACGGLSDGEVRCLAALMKDWTLNVTGTQGFGGAQVTAGGILLEEFGAHTLESRLCPGLPVRCGRGAGCGRGLRRVQPALGLGLRLCGGAGGGGLSLLNQAD